MTPFGQRPDDERVLSILREARSAPLPATPERRDLQRGEPARSEAAREERRREQIKRLAQTIGQVPVLLHRRRTLRRRIGVATATFVAAAAAVVVFALPHSQALPELARSGALAPVTKTVAARSQGLILRQVVGKVIATHEDGSDVVLSKEMSLDEGDQISTTAEAYASLELEAGTRVDLASATTLESVHGRELVLRVGRVDLNVPKVPGVAPRLVVNTPDTQVVVRGTIFSVEVEGTGAALVTAVGVTRGAVSVFHDGQERLIEAGRMWSSAAPTETSPLFESDRGLDNDTGATVGTVSEPEGENAGPVEAPAVVKPRAGRRAKSEPAPVAEQPEAKVDSAQTSNLSQQNRVFARGLRARDQGDDRRAVYWFDQLLRRYPNSPLAESAERERTAARARLSND
jgi:hypothetical protein